MRHGSRYIATAVALVLISSLSLSLAAPAKTEPATDEDIDRQIGAMLQKLEKADNLAPRDKRAVNVLTGLLGGGGGGSFLNELNKGPTYSQLLGGGGGGFNKAGLLSGILGSSSGTAIFNRRPLVSLSVGGGAGIIDEDPDLVALRLRLGADQQSDATRVDLNGPKAGISAHFSIPFKHPFKAFLSPDPPSTEIPQDAVNDDYSESDDDESATIDDNSEKLRDVPLREDTVLRTAADVSEGPYPAEAPEPEENITDFPSKPVIPANGGGEVLGGGGASAGASFSAGGSGGADASAAVGGGLDSGSILGLVTPLLGSSSAGASSGGTDGASASAGASIGGGGLGVSAGASGGANAELPDVLRDSSALYYKIKSFIFRKLVQLLGSSSGSPQAG